MKRMRGKNQRVKEVAPAIRGRRMKTIRKWTFLLICFTIIWQVSNAGICGAAGPVLFFSDVNWGPKTGWEGSANKGAAVSVWGKNLGTARGDSFITVNGARLATASDYAEWGVIGPARSLERITFWLNSACQDGNGTITVTVGGFVSNALDFRVMAGKIYFISVADGNNSFNGLYSTARGGSNGPFRDILKFNPGLNPSGSGESYICYVKGGTYTSLDVDNAFVALRGPYGSETIRHGLIAYPGETPQLDATNAGAVIWNAAYAPYERNNYFTYSKLKVFATNNRGWEAFGLWGDHNRVIGNHMKDLLADIWSGVVMVDNSQYSEIYGNFFDHLGYDSYKHNIYIKTHQDHAGSAEYTYVGWNEFNDATAGQDARGGVIFISKESTVTAKYTRYIYIHDNYFHDGNMEFIYTGDNTELSDIYIYNNIFSHGTCANGGGVYLAWHTRSVYLYNNLFYQMGDPRVPMVSVTGNTTAVFRNNIFYSRPGQAFLALETYQGASINSDHDLFYDPAGSASTPSGAGITMTNPVRRDPRFVNASAYDFHLATNSPAINAGTSEGLNLTSYVPTDYDGNGRPLAGLYDIGPFEGEGSGGGGDLIPPAAPRGLIILR
jgi:hypothetical protein